MEQLRVSTSTHDYTITVGKGIRFHLNEYLTKRYSKIMIITDDIVAEYYLKDVMTGLSNYHTFHFNVPSGEQSKDIDTYYQLQTELMKHHFDRESVIIALGGGVVGDLAGFVAATYMRGIDFIQVPTTILSHDSSVGGKVGINHAFGKNLIGSFYPPRAVVYDIDTLETLPNHEIRSGYAELVKEAFISDVEFLEDILNTNIQTTTNEKVAEHLMGGIRVKANIVEQDERELGIRKHLNFGHTFAHALEKEVGYGEITHGEAVALGMLFALKLGQTHYPLEEEYRNLLKWLKLNEYPLSITSIDIKKLVDHMKHDKKAHGDVLQFVLLKEIGSPFIVDVTEKEVLNTLESFKKELDI